MTFFNLKIHAFAIPLIAAASSIATPAFGQVAGWRSVEGIYADALGCVAIQGTKDPWVIRAGSIEGPGLFCSIERRSRTPTGFSIFLQCKANNNDVTYYGNIDFIHDDRINLEVIEYRNATSAPDIRLRLARCRN